MYSGSTVYVASTMTLFCYIPLHLNKTFGGNSKRRLKMLMLNGTSFLATPESTFLEIYIIDDQNQRRVKR